MTQYSGEQSLQVTDCTDNSYDYCCIYQKQTHIRKINSIAGIIGTAANKHSMNSPSKQFR